ncbi:MAG: cation diffusion facilitator family transporter [Planctomycetota bacterium]
MGLEGVDWSNGSSPRPIYRHVTRAALLGLAINLSLGIVKLVGGIVGSSFALISDAVNSLGDSLTSLVVIGGLWYAQRPPDEEHPYGHTRAEAVAASNVALLIIVSALFVGWEAITRSGIHQQLPPVWTLWIAGGNVVIKLVLYDYKLRVGRRTKSSVIIANAWDHRSDAMCSLSVLVGLGVVRWGGPAYAGADVVTALVVVVAIVWSGIELFRNSVSELLDPQADSELVQRVRERATEVSQVRGVDKLWVRKTGVEYLVDIHIQVDAQLSVEDGHRIGHVVKEKLIQEFACLRDVLVHLEPYPHSHEQP